MLAYLCNAFDEAIKQERGIVTDSPAATRKVFLVSEAITRAGLDVRVLSLGRGRQNNSWRRFRFRDKKTGNVKASYATFWHVPILTHVVSALSMLKLLVAHRKAGGRYVLAYNRSVHYLPALLYAKYSGMSCFLDLEDGWPGEVNIFQWLLSKAYDELCDAGVMLACEALGVHEKQENRYVCYGAVTPAEVTDKQQDGPLTVLFGGSLQESTGGSVFLEGMSIFAHTYPDLLNDIKVVVTGFGSNLEEIRMFSQQELISEFVEVRGQVSLSEYRSLLGSSHVGLCLKLSEGELHDSTFPSKVMEFAEYGLLLLSTPVSDVPRIFSNDSALLLEDDHPKHLADALAWCLNNRGEVAMRAQAGNKMVLDRFSLNRVGEDLVRFIRSDEA